MAEEEEVNDTGIKPQHDEVTSKAVAESEVKTMTPWEQHSAVITIPRFDYNAPSALLRHSHSGFLITCTIKREKSATKEAISILEKFVGFFNGCTSESLERTDENASKRRKPCTENIDGISVLGGERIVDKHLKGTSTTPVTRDIIGSRSSVLSLVKLTRSGLLLFTFPKEISPDTVHVVSNIIQTMQSESSRPLLWCHRIFPIQATCCLNEKDLHSVVLKLVLQFISGQNDLPRPLKFAVGFNRRGVEETEMKRFKDVLIGSEANILLDRNKCFSVVAAAVKEAVPDSVVDLKSPELSVLVELLPLSGVSLGSLVVGVSVLPKELVSTKPRLSIKTLIPDTKAKNLKA